VLGRGNQLGICISHERGGNQLMHLHHLKADRMAAAIAVPSAVK
jgi:hypothetical protein